MSNYQPVNFPQWKAWMISTRPKTLVAAFGPLILSTAYLFDSASDIARSLSWYRVIGVWMACFILQIACNLTNDYFDYVRGTDDQNRVGPKRMLQQGVITKEEVIKSLILLYGLFFFIAVVLAITLSWGILFLALMSMAVAFFYTGGKYPLSYHGLGDFFAFWFFGPVLTMIIIYVMGYGSLPFDAFTASVLGLGPGFFSLTLININNIRDLDQDRLKGKKTMAIFFGKKISRWLMVSYFVLAMLLPIIIAWYYEKNGYQLLLVFLIPSWLFAYRAFRSEGEGYNRLLAFTAEGYLIQSITFSLIWLIGGL